MNYIKFVLICYIAVMSVFVQAGSGKGKLVAGFPLTLQPNTKVLNSSNTNGVYYLQATSSRKCKDVAKFYTDQLTKKSIKHEKEEIGEFIILLRTKKGSKPEVTISCKDGFLTRGSKKTVHATIVIDWK